MHSAARRIAMYFHSEARLPSSWEPRPPNDVTRRRAASQAVDAQ